AVDPRAANKTLYIKPPANTMSHNELVSLWEKKTGKKFTREYVPEDVVLNKIREAPFPMNFALAIAHAAYIKGDLTNFEIEPSFGVEASELYP
ncbi:NmrA family NAD(P)-binding protein, partial [Clostridium perfringens]|nr:NmrA family NAD(P)-binding protein [Clostridium perfringens]